MKQLWWFTALAIIITPVTSMAQESSDTTTLITAHMEQRRNKDPNQKGVSNEQLKRGDPQQVLPLLANYLKDESTSVRNLACKYLKRMADVNPQPVVRQEVARILVKFMFEPNNGLASNVYEVLFDFSSADFPEDAKQLLLDNFAKGNAGRLTIRLCGIANIQESLPRLKELLIDEVSVAAKCQNDTQRWSDVWCSTGWSARLARARMGIPEDIQKCLELVDQEEDKTFRVSHLLLDVGYIRQPEAIRYLQRYLDSNETLPPTCGPTGELYGIYTMSILADSLRNYPVQKRAGREYRREELNLCREWMKQQTEWQIRR